MCLLQIHAVEYRGFLANKSQDFDVFKHLLQIRLRIHSQTRVSLSFTKFQISLTTARNVVVRSVSQINTIFLISRRGDNCRNYTTKQNSVSTFNRTHFSRDENQ